jgi:hypothetical protein
MGFKICTEIPPARHQPAAEFTLRPIVLRQSELEIAWESDERIGKRLRIQRRFGDAGDDMGPGGKSRIPE